MVVGLPGSCRAAEQHRPQRRRRHDGTGSGIRRGDVVLRRIRAASTAAAADLANPRRCGRGRRRPRWGRAAAGRDLGGSRRSGRRPVPIAVRLRIVLRTSRGPSRTTATGVTTALSAIGRRIRSYPDASRGACQKTGRDRHGVRASVQEVHVKRLCRPRWRLRARTPTRGAGRYRRARGEGTIQIPRRPQTSPTRTDANFTLRLR
jgi:hypothetical protein